MPKGFFFLQELESPMTSVEKAFLINKLKKKHCRNSLASHANIIWLNSCSLRSQWQFPTPPHSYRLLPGLDLRGWWSLSLTVYFLGHQQLENIHRLLCGLFSNTDR